MTFFEARQMLSEIKYKRDWRFELHERDFRASWQLYVCFNAPDARTGQGWGLVVCTRSIAAFGRIDEKQFVSWVFGVVMEAERHEAEEFFRYRGVQIYDPHKKDEASLPEQPGH